MVHFFQRTFPSANMIVLTGTKPILVDSGFGAEIDQTIALIQSIGVRPQDLQMVVNTHWHCDHNGGNHHFQTQYQIPIAAHHNEAKIINQGLASACDANWLVQPIEQYSVDIFLKEGDILNTGTREWQVIETPGHSPGHLSYFSDGILIAGDTVHADDIAWLNTMLYPDTCSSQMMASLDKLVKLNPSKSYSGHGVVTENPLEQIDIVRRRLERWLDKPKSMAWHAMKRIFAYHIMLTNGLNEADTTNYLLSAPWFKDYATKVFDTSPTEFVQPLLDEMIRSSASYWENGILYPTAPFIVPNRAWLQRVMNQNWQIS